MFGLLHLGTVRASSCCEQKSIMKQLRRGVDFGDCFKGIEAIKMGKARWLHSGRNGQGRLFHLLLSLLGGDRGWDWRQD